MNLLAFLLPLAQEDVTEEGRKIITAMLIVALVFLSVIALGQLSRYLAHRRHARRRERRPY